MFIRTTNELEAKDLVKSLGNGLVRSARFLTAVDGLGFSYNENRIAGGYDSVLWYKNHWEANYMVSGQATLTDLSSGTEWALGPGDLYMVGPNDRHRFRTSEGEHHLSVFCPALRGDERHDADGGYEAHVPGPNTDRRMFVKRGTDMRAADQEMIFADGRDRTLRMLVQADNVGFGFSDVHFAAGADTVIWFKHHWEANHILAGRFRVTNLTSGEAWELGPGMAYNVGPKDRHRLQALTDVHLVSIFCPALRGDETHDEDGSLSPSGPVPPGPQNG
jgi:quercetin dioxygenase-like cupin family protein